MLNFDFKKFENALIQNDYYICDNLFSSQSLNNLREYFEMQKSKDSFNPARIGKGPDTAINSEIRSDHIFWINDWNATVELLEYEKFLSNVMSFCRENFYLPLKRFESHFALYENGSFYKKHLDCHKNSPHRLITAVLYLSEFKENNGGQLVIYPTDNSNAPVKVNPVAGRVVIFKSDSLIHEVLTTNANRYSLTSWLRDDLE